MSRNYSTTKIEMSKFDHAILISMLDIKNMKHASYTHIYDQFKSAMHNDMYSCCEKWKWFSDCNFLVFENYRRERSYQVTSIHPAWEASRAAWSPSGQARNLRPAQVDFFEIWFFDEFCIFWQLSCVFGSLSSIIKSRSRSVSKITVQRR